MARIEITNGPSEMRLMMSLFRQAEGANVTYFSVDDDRNRVPQFLPIEINALTRARLGAGACDRWAFEGTVIDQYGKNRNFVYAYVKGELDTSTRKGWLDYEVNPDCEDAKRAIAR